MSAAPKLPRELQVAAWIALVLSALVGLASAMETQALVYIREATPAPSGPLPGDPRMLEAMTRAQIQALESMRGPRLAVLVALAFTCGLGVVSSARLLWPGPLSREGMRRIAGGAAIASGVLRTLDGAMSAVVGQRVGTAVAKLSGPLEGLGAAESEMLQSLAPSFLVAVMVILTLVFGGAFIAVGQYLRSERARRLLEPQ